MGEVPLYRQYPGPWVILGGGVLGMPNMLLNKMCTRFLTAELVHLPLISTLAMYSHIPRIIKAAGVHTCQVPLGIAPRGRFLMSEVSL